MASHAYKRLVAEGKGVLIFAFIFAIITRLAFYVSHMNDIDIYMPIKGGYLWDSVAFLFSSPLVSLTASTVFTLFIALLLSKINTKHLFIRQPSVLPSAFVLLLFNCHPSFLIMRAEYIGLLFLLFAVDQLFGAYQSNKKQHSALNVYVAIMVGSLFSPGMMLFIPFAWIGLGIMKSFNIKVFLVSLLCIVFTYFPFFSYYYFTENISQFYSPLISLMQTWDNLVLHSFNYLDYAFLFTGLLSLGILFFQYYINSYKDKIRTRMFFLSIFSMTIFGIILYLTGGIFASTMALFATLLGASQLYGHFFALNTNLSFKLYFILYLVGYCFTFFHFHNLF